MTGIPSTARSDLLDNKMQEVPDARQDMEMADGGRPGQGSNAGSLNQVPEARTDHTFVRYKNRFYVYGGRDEVQIFKDIHEYSIVSNQWKQIFIFKLHK